MLIITDAGLQALDGKPARVSSQQSTPTKTRAMKPHRRNVRKTTAAAPKSKAPLTARQGTKQALLIDLLKRKKGATIEKIVEATGWQPHSVRGTTSGTLKKKLGLAVTSERVGDAPRRYRIVAPQS